MIFFLIIVIGIWTTIKELYPGFSLYRGIYEFAQYGLVGRRIGTQGIQWKDLSNTKNGMRTVLVFTLVECLIILFVAYYFDKQALPKNNIKRKILSILKRIFPNPLSLSRNTVKKRILLLMLNICKNSSPKTQESSTVSIEMENHDVSKEFSHVNLYAYCRLLWGFTTCNQAILSFIYNCVGDLINHVDYIFLVIIWLILGRKIV